MPSMATLKLSPAEILEGVELATEALQRPRTRGDCEDGPRPCPWVSCRHHLYLDVNKRTGSLHMYFPVALLWEDEENTGEIPPTCALDVADEGEHDLLEIAGLIGRSRERVRQIEERALAKLAFNPDLKAV